VFFLPTKDKFGYLVITHLPSAADQLSNLIRQPTQIIF